MSVSQAVKSKISLPGQLPPGPSTSLINSIFHLRDLDRLGGLVSIWQQYGDIVFTKFGPIRNYMLFSPEFVHHVMVANQKNYIKGMPYNGFRMLAGEGLVTNDTELWKQQRRMMSPHFTPTAVLDFSGMMAETIEHMLVRWDKAAASGEPLNIDHEMMRLTMSVIGRAMFSLDLGEELGDVSAAFQGAFSFIPDRSVNPFVPMAIPLPSHLRFKRDLAAIDRFIYERIADGRRNGSRDDLLSIMLKMQDEESGHGMDDRQLRDELVTVFFAGFETTARSLTWAWYLLANHPDVFAKLTAEAQELLGGRAPADGDLDRLKYVRMVVDETLRLYPPTALLARQNLEADEIGGYRIPPKSMISLVPYIVHRYPAYWPDAERFDPERFTPEAAAGRPRFAYIPFAAGPRVCLGNSFALMEMVYALAMASARFSVTLSEDATILPTFAGTTRPSQALYLKLARRN